MSSPIVSTYNSHLPASIDRVWHALTHADLVREYFFGTDQQSTYQVGDPITWTGSFNGQSYQDKGTILESVPGKKLKYSYLSSWSGLEDKPENYLWVQYQLEPGELGTELSVSFSSYDEEKARHSLSSWAMIIDGLKKVLA